MEEEEPDGEESRECEDVGEASVDEVGARFHVQRDDALHERELRDVDFHS